MASSSLVLPRPPSHKENDETDSNSTDFSWLTYWKQGGEEIPDELQDTVGLETTVTVSQGTSRKAVADAVSLVVGSSRNGLVGLCTEVAKIVKANAELQLRLNKLESSRLESLVEDSAASHGTSSVSLPRISSAQARPVSRDSGTVQMESTASLESIRDVIQSSQTDLVRGKGEKPIAALLRNTRDQITTALQDVRHLTIHDDNVERQYRETVDINQKLEQELEQMRKEMTKLRGKLSMAEIAPRKLRAEMARRQDVQRRRRAIDEETRHKRPENERYVLPRLLTAEERSLVVNAKGEYVNSKDKSNLSHPNTKQSLKTHTGKSPDTLPPALFGCSCSVCRSIQSMRATSTANDARSKLQMMIYSSHRGGEVVPITRGGQQIFIGDRVIVRGERTGTVKYIGKLEGVRLPYTNHIFLGLQLDQPTGHHDGIFQGHRYFTSAPRHGAFVNVKDVTCVITRQAAKPIVNRSPSRLTRLKQEQQLLKAEASQKKKEQVSLMSESAQTRTKLREQEVILTKIKGMSEDSASHEGDKDIGMTVKSKGDRPASGITEDSDVADLWTKINQLMDKKPKVSNEAGSDVDKHTVEEAVTQVLQLADTKNTGWVDTEDFIHLLNSQALCMNLTDAEADILVSKSQSSLKKQVNYRLLAPSLLSLIATTKADGGSKPGAHDWCNFYSRVHEKVVYYNLRSEKVQLRCPSEIDRERTMTLDQGTDIKGVFESSLLEVLETKDIRKSGFLSHNELAQVLKSSDVNLQLSEGQVKLVLAKCSQQWDIKLGIPYINHIPQLRQFMSDSIRETAGPGSDAWCEIYTKKTGLFYLNKRTGDLQTTRPSGKLYCD
ncbi:uncharacterized protein LOC134193824 [Corticium candelabrum]|uniref:uncharacterized protein LOC134193824 n=1 Tax=Corticium candelabrum TaxID=121492 RepID=UPI002E259398|nr:uncharacterized protein LOC134193824 [Corticium candelabrum]